MYTWLNPPAGTFTIEEYLKMHHYYMNVSSNFGENKLSAPTDPLKSKFFGNKRLTVYEDHVELEDIT
jgi:hypothetical protein